MQYSFNQPAQVSDWNTNFTLPLFNPSLGTLEGVRYHLDASANSTVSLINLSTNSGSHVTGAVDSYYYLSDAFSSIVIDNKITGTTAADLAVNTFGNHDTSGAYGIEGLNTTASGHFDNSTVDADDLAHFTGVGNFTLNLDMVGYITATGTGGNAEGHFSTIAAGSGFVEYSYSPQAVPEPASMAALGLGLVAVVRRRRSAK